MSGGGFRMSDGDWICCDAQCGNINFARRTHCNRCGLEKKEVNRRKLGQEIGTAAAAKSHGLFSADDWQCVKCANVNWARRQACNVCNAPRYGEVEERTGLGGGYNDRGVVEYRKREDSDDEYDEFGRRKKRRRADSDQTNGRDSPNSETEINKRDENEENSPESKVIEKVELEKEAEVEEEGGREDDDEEEEEEEEDDDGDLSKYDLSDWVDEKK